jgi:MFS family permease
MSSDSTVDDHAGPLRRRLYALGFVDEFGPLYALYTVLFLDNGITTGQISTVFLLWAAIEVAFEVPSGAIADLVDRRTLLAFAFVLRAVGISVWLIEPSFAGVVVGAALWSVHQSLASGAWEAMIHDQLTAVDQAGSYARTMARMEQFSAIGITLGALVATGLVAIGATIVQLGWITVAVHAVSIVLVLTLPDVRWVADDDDAGHDDERGAFEAWRTTLRDGVRYAWSTPVALRLIALGAVLEGLYLFDDYVPILADERGADDAVIPIFFAVIFVGLVVGNEFVARRPRVSGRAVGVSMCAGALALGGAALSTSMWPLLLVGVGYAAQEVTWAISDARFQERLPQSTRATVTSVRSFLGGVVGIAAFGTVTLLSTSEISVWALAGVAGVLFVAGLAATRWIPESTTTN